MTYTAWYIPDGYSEPLTMDFCDDDFPPYDLIEEERIDFMLNEIGERGEPLEIRRSHRGPDGRTTFDSLVWHNVPWGID